MVGVLVLAGVLIFGVGGGLIAKHDVDLGSKTYCNPDAVSVCNPDGTHK